MVNSVPTHRIGTYRYADPSNTKLRTWFKNGLPSKAMIVRDNDTAIMRLISDLYLESAGADVANILTYTGTGRFNKEHPQIVQCYLTLFRSPAQLITVDIQQHLRVNQLLGAYACQILEAERHRQLK